MATQPRIFLDRRSTNARRILSRLDVDLVDDPAEADLLWMRRGYEKLQFALGEHQLLNHIPEERSIVDKGELTTCLHEYDRTREDGAALRVASFYPETYRLYDPDERARFFAQLPEAPSKEDPWVLKPTNSSKGRGVAVLYDFEKLSRVYSSPRIDEAHRKKRIPRYLAQRYVKDVLLLDSRKSEIRIYWLVASTDPLMVLMYGEGTTRLTSLPFKLDDFDNPLIHITNTYQQKRHRDYDPAAVLKWDFARLEEYVSAELGIAPPDYLESQLKPRLKECLAFVVRSATEPLCRVRTPGHHFGLFGADFIIDDRGVPWLTEVQKGPGLSHDDPIKERLIPAMVRETLEIALEIQHRKRAGLPHRPSESVRGFEWIIGGGGEDVG